MGSEMQVYEVVIQNLRDKTVQKILVSFANGWHMKSFDNVLEELQQGRGRYDKDFTILEVIHVGQLSEKFRFI